MTAPGLPWHEFPSGLCLRPVFTAKSYEADYTTRDGGPRIMPRNVNIHLRGRRVLRLPRSAYSVSVSYSVHAYTWYPGEGEGGEQGELDASIETKLFKRHRASGRHVSFAGYAALNALGPSVGRPAIVVIGSLGRFRRTRGTVAWFPCPKVATTGNVVGVRLSIGKPRIGRREWPGLSFTVTKTGVDRHYPTGSTRPFSPKPPLVTRPASVHTAAGWWRPVHAWWELYQRLRADPGVGADQRGIFERLACVTPVLGRRARTDSTNFVTRWADSRLKGWHPEQMGRPVRLELRGRRLFPISTFSAQLAHLNPRFRWSVGVRFRVVAGLTNHRWARGGGPLLSMNVSWVAHVLRNGKVLPRGTCFGGNGGKCSTPTASLNPSVLFDGYGPTLAAPAVSGYLRAGGHEAPGANRPGSHGLGRFLAPCPNFAPTGNTVGLTFSASSVQLTDRSGGLTLTHRIVESRIVHLG